MIQTDAAGDAASDDPPGIADARSLRRFWREARGFWRDHPVAAWGLIGALTVCVALELLLQYKLNFWNRDFFNALEQRNSRAIWTQVYLLPVLVGLFVALAIFAVWGRMTFQRSWRAWLTTAVTGVWFPSLRHAGAGQINGERQNAEYRIAEDARVATDAPIDLFVGLLSSLLGGATFIVVLWNVGGTLDLAIGAQSFSVEGYLVYAALLYSTMTTVAMIWMGRHMIRVIERKNQAEADLRYGAVHMRATGRRPHGGAGTGWRRPALAAPVQPAHAHDNGLAGQRPAGAGDRPDPLCAQLRAWSVAAWRGHPGGRRVLRGAIRVQLARRQLSAPGGDLVLRLPRRRPAAGHRRADDGRSRRRRVAVIQSGQRARSGAPGAD